MLDLVTGFAFNMASDPAPDATVREDSNEGGNGTMKGKKGNQFGSTVSQFGKDFQEMVTKGFKEMMKRQVVVIAMMMMTSLIRLCFVLIVSPLGLKRLRS